MLDTLLSSLALAVSGLFPADTPVVLNGMNLPPRTRQALVVSCGGWNETAGRMRRYERGSGADGWRVVRGGNGEEEFAVVLGKKGMGWGRGLHRAGEKGPQKAEGDGRAPAGVFALGDAFGYAAEAPSGTRWGYRASTARDFFVDDAKSPDYNRWVTLSGSAKPEDRWASFERMRRKDRLYEFGVVVNHNMAPVSPGAGSAIFLHGWRAADEGTAGCTAMPRERMEALIRWLDPEAHPLLIQAPADRLGALRLK